MPPAPGPLLPLRWKCSHQQATPCNHLTFTTISLLQANVRMLAEDTAINSGVYTFNLVMDGEPTVVQARYSFTYKKVRPMGLLFPGFQDPGACPSPECPDVM